MKKIFLAAVFTIGFSISNAQIIADNRWSDLFSYNNVLSIREDDGKLIAATENGIFYYNISTGEISKLSKANGLHEVKISAFDYNPQTDVGLVGYQNGSLDVITPDGVFLIVDIPIATGFTGNKKINHVSINGNTAVISVAYGVSIFDLENREFGDSAFFTTGGTFVAANESVIRDNKVYTATSLGILTHEMDVTFPVYSTWTNIFAGNFTQIANGNVLAFSNATTVRYGDGATFAALPNLSNIRDLTVDDSNILVATQALVNIYNLSGGAPIQSQSIAGNIINTGIYRNSQIFAGTRTLGIVNQAGNSIKPDGPYNNKSYKIDLFQNQIVISTGVRTAYNDPVNSGLGYYHFNGTQWIYPDFFLTNPPPLNILDAVINPSNPSEIFFTNYVFNLANKGIYKMNNDVFVKKYLSNVGSAVTDRIVGLTFDENNQLFASGTFLGDSPYKLGYFYYNASSDDFIRNEVIIANGAQKPFASNGFLYIPAPFFGDGGMLIYNYKNTPANTSDDQFMIIRQANNLPVNGTISAVLDKNNNLWIGTRTGLRVLSNPESAIEEENPQTEPIIIEENGLGEELFRDNEIFQIAVDSGNQKWVSVNGGGVFYLDSSGEQTLQHFTKANSPLPNDSVTDIKIDENNGKIYFATLDGVVVYQGDVVSASENFGDVLVYPNPVVYANYKGNVRIRGLAAKTNIRITDAAGNLVHSAVTTGGFYEWNLNNFRGVRVASGIYFVLMTNEDGTDTATAKIAVVN
ncbi:MAG: T9SS type A sorting domain-containing protein [Flavobacteriaceae bacterium]|jgi:hypothetical protein|nr:T9SS type A sorting domain-containing protein [Flavobacteriaceae bacterium]